jgi:vacuolar protein sorting-associated protein 13A/C
MFSYDTDDRRNRALIKIDKLGYSYSVPQSFEAVGESYEVIIPKEHENEPGEAHLGVRIDNGVGQYKLTKIITIRPRWIVESYLDDAIYFRQPGSKDFAVLEPGAKKDIIYLSSEYARLQFRFGSSTRNKWSASGCITLTAGLIRST